MTRVVLPLLVACLLTGSQARPSYSINRQTYTAPGHGGVGFAGQGGGLGGASLAGLAGLGGFGGHGDDLGVGDDLGGFGGLGSGGSLLLGGGGHGGLGQLGGGLGQFGGGGHLGGGGGQLGGGGGHLGGGGGHLGGGGGGPGLDCGPGLVRKIDGNCVRPVINKNIFLYNAPQQKVSYHGRPQIPDPAIDYNYVFIKSPSSQLGPKPIVVPPAQQKTLVYVLSEQPKAQHQPVIEVPGAVSEPEVFFINYNEGENPTLPGGIDLQTALSQSAQLGQVIDGGPGGDGGLGLGIGGGHGGHGGPLGGGGFAGPQGDHGNSLFVSSQQVGGSSYT